MKIRALAPAFAVLALAGCGTASSTSTPARPAPAPVMALTSAQDRQECAALAAVNMGAGTYAEQVRVVAGQYSVSQAEAQRMIARVIRDACPSLVSVIPPGDPLP
jgi:hypothetical protein